MRRRTAILLVSVAILAARDTGALAQNDCSALRAPYLFLSPEGARQQRLGTTCSDKEIAKEQRTVACEELAEDVEHGGAEFRVADDQLLILLEKDSNFFFEFFQGRSPLFDSWLRGIATSSFVAPYLYNNTTAMEERRRCLIELLKRAKVQRTESESMRDRIIRRLTPIKVRVVD